MKYLILLTMLLSPYAMSNEPKFHYGDRVKIELTDYAKEKFEFYKCEAPATGTVILLSFDGTYVISLDCEAYTGHMDGINETALELLKNF